MERYNRKINKILNNELTFMPNDLNNLISNFTYCCPDNECDRCFYKRKYYGAQDKYTNERILLKYNKLEFMASRRFPRSNWRISDPNKSSYSLIMPQNTIVKNFRLNNMENVRTVEIEIGGQRMDKVYQNIIPMLQNLYQVEEDVIPFYFSVSGINSLSYHEIKINVEYYKGSYNDELVFDIYKWKDVKKKIDNIMYQLQFTGTEDLTNTGLNIVRLYFNHPIIHLMTRGYHPEELELEFNDDDKFFIQKTKTIGDVSLYEIADNFYDYKNGINFSIIHKARLIIRDANLRYIDIYAINCEGIRCESGMAGLVYSM